MNQDSIRRTLIKSGAQPPNVEEQIRLRAYQLYEERGRQDGRELEDWLQAEDEIVHKRARSIAA